MIFYYYYLSVFMFPSESSDINCQALHSLKNNKINDVVVCYRFALYFKVYVYGNRS